jgi:hypothetical protein
MDCPKCKGTMMLERFSDFFLVFYAWKCFNCGALIDPTNGRGLLFAVIVKDCIAATPPDGASKASQSGQ